NKEKYTLSQSGTLFDQLILDIYRARNEFLMDALFMKGGKLKAEFEGDFQRLSKFGRLINKGHAKLKLFERSFVIVPEDQDAFSVHYDFVNFHEFDEMEYSFKLVTDGGGTILISKLGNDFEFFQERLDELLGGMYERLINDVLKQAFAHFHAATLLKLAYKMKGGKAVSYKEIAKIDKDLAVEIEQFVFSDEVFKEKVGFLREMIDEYNIYFGIAEDSAVKGSFVRWVMFCLPEKNIVAFSILPRWQQGGETANGNLNVALKHEMLFFKIIMEQGRPAEKVEDKVREIDHALVILNFVKDPCYKDKRELKHSPYQYAIRKMPFLRILRKSFVGKIAAADVNEWKKQANDILSRSVVLSD
ncbi:hypothetical protein HY604_04630, partial [Candidatus Peregrinibacteria bacterium]|nr:hypothetical protein [Candidatus Peregrinibacteria bacterium]